MFKEFDPTTSIIPSPVITPETFDDYMILLDDLLKKRRSMTNPNLTPDAFAYYYKQANLDYEAIVKMVLKLTQDNAGMSARLDELSTKASC